jgi:CheY-like chemotaxis protein
MVILDNDKTANEGINATKILKLHKKTLNIPVVFISSDPDVDSLAQDAGAEFYLRKPIDIRRLEKVVSQIDKAIKP